MAEDPKIYTLAEVSEHSNSKACWLIISGKVYNVTKFLDEHPGGDEILLISTGRDATHAFEEVGHSEDAKSMMAQFYVGEIDAATLPKNEISAAGLRPNDDKLKNQPYFSREILCLIVPLAILGLAMLLRIYMETKE